MSTILWFFIVFTCALGLAVPIGLLWERHSNRVYSIAARRLNRAERRRIWRETWREQ